MTVVLIDVEKKVLVILLVLFKMERDTFSIFVGGLVSHHSSDFSRGISLFVFERFFYPSSVRKQ
jgi:hypothetical protein